MFTNDEMNQLVDELLTSMTPNYTPEGKPVLTLLNDEELEKHFK